MILRCLTFCLLLATICAPDIHAQSENQPESQRMNRQRRSRQMQQRQRQRKDPRENDKGLKIGDEAPAFVLKSLDGESETTLVDLVGTKPIVLMFGSYT